MQVPPRQRSVEGFRRGLRRAEEYVRLRAAAAAGDREAEGRFLLVQLEERQLDHAAAIRRHTALDPELDPELLAAIDLRLLDLEVATLVRAGGQEGRHELGPRFLAMLRDGPRPSPWVTRGFWFAILEWAERESDAEAFSEALTGMREALQVTDPDEPWVEKLLDRYEAKLQHLRR